MLPAASESLWHAAAIRRAKRAQTGRKPGANRAQTGRKPGANRAQTGDVRAGLHHVRAYV